MSAEFRVNQYQDNWQREPDVMALADGGFRIFYESYVNDYGEGPAATVIATRRYDAAGRAVTEESLISGTDGTKSDDVRATRLTDGAYAVTWVFDDYDDILSTRDRAFVQVFEADGSARSAAVRVDSLPANNAVLPEVVATRGGGFTVVFDLDRSTGSFDDIFAQDFDAQARKIGGNRLLNTVSNQFDEITARSAQLTGGGTVTIWNSEGAITVPGGVGQNQIRATITDAGGRVIRADVGLYENYGSVGSGSGAGYDVAALAGGGFATVNMNYDHDLGLDTPEASYHTMLRIFDAAGGAARAPVTVFAGDDLPREARLAQLATGEIVVVWSQQDDAPGVIGDSIYGRVFTASGAALTARFEISTDRYNYDDQADPEIAALAGGGFVVTYTSDSVDADDGGVAARLFGRGTAGADRLSVDVSGQMAGLGGDDVLTGDGRANRISGGAGRDTIRGGDGADSLDGGTGDDVIFGGASRADLRDVITGGVGDDRIDGGYGNDLLYGGAGADEIAGGFGADTVIGNEGADVLTGGAFGDMLVGGDGFDFLNGGFGSDRLVGGAGPDRFYHLGVAGHGNDWIQDYSGAEGDRLVWGGGQAGAGRFQVNYAATPGAGAAWTQEAFVIDKATGQILWALVDGAEETIRLQVGTDIYEL
ncbi:calcium-binding protein [Pseudoroseicyclus aestuarii]|uniref:Hemolysin type calcium-binding protein n=1 Tax=Pseudoroseicyclus aestuarii TaxID=1795041 RepID=A0A318SNB8_9RHOB|nr:calcium-binding protein [Pseudoroseicyclus aestuarii]PYE82186.1 hemolysin type calcium-binding protein [Pseudoroseicyclus aestuarii]